MTEGSATAATASSRAREALLLREKWCEEADHRVALSTMVG